MPLVVRGPGMPPASSARTSSGCTTSRPTLLRPDPAGARRRFAIDGRNLVPLIRDGSGRPPAGTCLIESMDKDSSWRSYDAIRTTSGYVYVEYAGSGVELYNLAKDPSQINNLAGRPQHAGLQHRMAVRLSQVRDCAGQGCR